MDKFSEWTGRAHATLIKSHPQLKLGHARECLAAWLGHRTYASLRVRDLAVLLGAARYVLTDDAAAIRRANDLGFPVSSDQWWAVASALTPSGISGGLWLTNMDRMSAAARLTFDDQPHPPIDYDWTPIGTTVGRRGTMAVRLGADGDYPDQLRFSVDGATRPLVPHIALAVPVVALVLFERVGARFYAEGKIASFKQSGQPYPYEDEFDCEVYGMSED